MLLQRTEHFIWLNSLSLSANVLSVTLPSNWWIASSSIQSCCPIMVVWLRCDWLHVDSKWKWWMRACSSPMVLLFMWSYFWPFILALRRVCHRGDITESKWHCWRAASVMLKEHFTSNLCGRPVCTGGLALWNQHLHPTVLTFSHQCACEVHNIEPGVFTWLYVSYHIRLHFRLPKKNVQTQSPLSAL